MQHLEEWLGRGWGGRGVALAVGLLLVLLATGLLRRWAARNLADSKSRYRMRKSVALFGYLAALLVLITAFSGNLGGLAVAFGAIGAGIAFALQEVIISVAGWLAVSGGGFYKAGDRVQLGGIKGDVIDIGILRTTLMELGEWVQGDLYSGRLVRVANSFVFKEPVFNYSADFPFLWDELRVPVRFGSDWHLMRSLLQRVAEDVTGEYAAHARQTWDQMVRKYMIEDARVEPTVTLVANDNWIEFTVRYVVEHKARRTTKDQLFERILAAVAETEGKVQLASATFELVASPALDVRVAHRRAEG